MYVIHGYSWYIMINLEMTPCIMVSAQLHLHLPPRPLFCNRICRTFGIFCHHQSTRKAKSARQVNSGFATKSHKDKLQVITSHKSQTSCGFSFPSCRIFPDLDLAMVRWSSMIHQSSVPGMAQASRFEAVEEVQGRRLPRAQRIICRICNLRRQSKLGISCRWKWGSHGCKLNYKLHPYYIYI